MSKMIGPKYDMDFPSVTLFVCDIIAYDLSGSWLAQDRDSVPLTVPDHGVHTGDPQMLHRRISNSEL